MINRINLNIGNTKAANCFQFWFSLYKYLYQLSFYMMQRWQIMNEKAFPFTNNTGMDGKESTHVQ